MNRPYALYGGYFWAGASILILSALAALGT
jgi:hypothetical protein